MPSKRDEFVAALLAEVCVREAAVGRRLGVFAEHLPRVDPALFVQAAADRAGGAPLRVALLGATSAPRAPRGVTVTLDPTEANRWRNDALAREGVRTIVLVLGAASKVNSLRTALHIVKAGELRRAAAARCVALQDTPERRALYEALVGARADVPATPLFDFAAEVCRVGATSRAALSDQEPLLVALVGALPDLALFSQKGRVAARAALRRNLALVQRLADLSPRERARITAMAETGDASERERASAILRYAASQDPAELARLWAEEVRAALRYAPPDEAEVDSDDRDDEGDEQRPRVDHARRVDGDQLAVELMLERGGHGIKAAAERFARELEPEDDGEIDLDVIKVGREEVQPRAKRGTALSVTAFAELVTADVWGGVVTARDGVDYVGALKQLRSGDIAHEAFRPADREGARELLERAARLGFGPRDALEHWAAYEAARAALLDHTPALVDHPVLALAGDAALRDRVGALLDAYSAATIAVREVSSALRDAGSSDAARRLLAKVARLDLVVVDAGGELTAIAAPTHPFHLWRAASMAALLADAREELREIGVEAIEAIVAEPPPAAPHVVLSPFAIERLEKARALVCVANFGALPLFAEPTARHGGAFRARSLRKIAERLVRLMPHASLGLEVALIDPQSVGAALEDLLEVKSVLDDELPVPLHVTVYRTRAAREVTDEEDEEVAVLAGELRDGGGRLTVTPPLRGLSEVAAALASAPAHLAVVFDPGQGEIVRVGLAAAPSLSPLTIPRTYRYDAFDDRIEVVVAGESGPFAAYHEIFCETLDLPREDFVGRRSGASRGAKELEALADGAIWLVVADQAVEPTLRLGNAQRLDWRSDGGRDVVTFTAHPETVEALVHDAVRVAGLLPDEGTVKRTLAELLSFSGEAILSLAKPRPTLSQADPSHAKGALGELAAVRWYLERHPHALVVSLDEPTSRRWIFGHGSDDRQGDLLAIRATGGGPVLEVLEVKARDDERAVLKETAGRVEGAAVTQVDQTLAILAAIFGPAPRSPVVEARRDVLRDQLYRAVASRPYASDLRAELVGLLEELFDSGPVEFGGAVFLVRIGGAAERADGAPAIATSPAGNVVGVVRLTEAGEPRAATARRPSPPPRAPSPPPRAPSPTPRASSDRSVEPPRGASPEEERDERLRVLIGETINKDQVFWDPHDPERPLNNFGFLITGDAGAGKTQVIKALIADLAATHLPILALDFKNDYAGEFAERHGLEVYDASRDGLPFNPLTLVPNADGEVQPIRQIHEVAALLGRIWGLGVQQQAQLRRAISSAYEDAGIRPRTWYRAEELPTAPSFDDVVGVLQADAKTEKLLNRLDPLFDLGLFPDSGDAPLRFEEFLERRLVLDLHELPSDEIKGALAELVIVQLHGYVLRGAQPRTLQRLIVIDEAWRVGESKKLEELAREGRAFGVGIAIGTQFPGDVPEDLSGCLATQLLLMNNDPDHRRNAVRTLTGSASGREGKRLMDQLARLQKHEGFLRNQQHAPYTLVETTPYYRRDYRGAR